jgi:endonuclease I
VLLFCTGRSQAKTTFGTGVDNWNREHVWAQSHGIDEALPAYTDLHHLRATDTSVNGVRGDKDFKNVTHNSGNLVNDTYGSGSTYNYTDGTYFEARDEVKGDVARMLFYMAVRYEGGMEPNLELVNGTTTTTGNTLGDLASLMQWQLLDKVDNAERLRNNRVYNLQNNRNPFIDRPDLVAMIFTS